jgi:hypothetical protein
MDRHFKLLPVTLALLFAWQLPALAAKYPEDSPYSKIPVGSKLVLKTPITVPAGKISVKLSKQGDPPATIDPDQYDTECRLVMWQRAKQTRVIEKGAFTITKVRKDEEYVSTGHILPVGRFAGSGDGGPGWELHQVFLTLSSEQYPGVYQVECAYQDTFGEGIPLSVTLLRWAMSGEFDLIIAK